MKKMIKKILLIAAAFGFVVSISHAKVPEAPKDYLEKKNPFDLNKKETLALGKKIYEKRCEKCHGTTGDGQGKSAKDLNPPVQAFNTPGFLKGKKDGQLFWIIEQGSPKTDMDSFGPGTNYNHSADEIWAVVSYIRSKFTK